MSGLSWLSDTEDGDGHRIEKIDPCEAGTCRHAACHPGPPARTPLEPMTGQDLSGMAPEPEEGQHFLADMAGEVVTATQTALWTLGEATHLEVDDAMTDTEAALSLLRGLNFAIDNLSSQRREVLRFLADVLPKGTAEIEGFGPVKVANSASYTGWDHGSLVPRLATRIADDQGYPVGPIRAVIDAFLAFTGNPGRYRTEALRAAGLEPDEFASVKWSPSVVIEKDRK